VIKDVKYIAQTFSFHWCGSKERNLNINCFYMARDVTHVILFWKSTHPKTATTFQ